jgi:hypothetical protein
MWSNGGLFSGTMVKGSIAKLDIAWIELVFNTSAGFTLTGSEKNSVVYSVYNAVGTPTSVAVKKGKPGKVALSFPALLVFWLIML